MHALASAKPDERKRLSTVVSVKSTGKTEVNGEEKKKVVKRKASEGGSGGKGDRQKKTKRKST